MLFIDCWLCERKFSNAIKFNHSNLAKSSYRNLSNHPVKCVWAAVCLWVEDKVEYAKFGFWSKLTGQLLPATISTTSFGGKFCSFQFFLTININIMRQSHLSVRKENKQKWTFKQGNISDENYRFVAYTKFTWSSDKKIILDAYK